MVNIFFLQKTLLFLIILKYNSVELLNDFFFIKKIYKKYFLKKNIILKVGIDPTFHVIHLGHLIIIEKLFQFKKIFCKLILLIGNFTSIIGDPTYNDKNRKCNKLKIVSFNISYFLSQLNYFLKFEGNIRVYYNNEWLNVFNVFEIINLLYLINLNKIFCRNDLKKRYDNNNHIFLPELIYPILQSYDSIFIKSDIEIGGLDQKLNFLITRYIQKKFNSDLQIILLLPLLLGLDGIFKMSKSRFNFLSFNESFFNFFCKIFFLSKKFIIYYYNNIIFKKNKKSILYLKYTKKNLLFDFLSRFLNKKYFFYYLKKIFYLKVFKLKFIYLFIYKLLKLLNLTLSYSKSIIYIKFKSFKLNDVLIINYNFILLKGLYLFKIRKKNFFIFLF